MKLHISNPEKISCPSIGFPAGISCPKESKNWSVCKTCYAKGGQCRRKTIQNLLNVNLDLWKQDPNTFKSQLVSYLFNTNPEYFRWQWSGDSPNPEFFAFMFAVAEAFPKTKFLCFTKNKKDLFTFLNTHPNHPKNLTLRLSNTRIDSYNPEFSAHVSYLTEAPKEYYRCPGNCKNCRFCWHSTKPVVFSWHGDALMRQEMKKK
jgi:hypothetical protein